MNEFDWLSLTIVPHRQKLMRNLRTAEIILELIEFDVNLLSLEKSLPKCSLIILRRFIL